MRYGPLFLMLAGVVTVALAVEFETSDLKKELDSLSQQIQSLKADLENDRKENRALKADLENEHEKHQNILRGLTRQVMLQQLNTEETMRSGGDSGIKQIRNRSYIGTRSYYSATHNNNNAVNDIHDHKHSKVIVGMGEVIIVMNGVEFRTRHNDYPLRQPHATDTGYHQTEQVQFPPVPPSILPNMTLTEQVAEMKEWFRAWKHQDTTKRDYRPYFKPLMCYVEGAWTQTGDKIEEPFHSERHSVDASTWWDLTEKVRFTAYSGSKSNSENYSFLPKKIMNLINNNTEPVWAQWNYRIVCAPVKDIPTRFLQPVDDLSTRMKQKQSLKEYAMSKHARFFPNNYYRGHEDKDVPCMWCYIDSIMEQIPGMDNYPGYHEDDAFGMSAMSADKNNLDKKLNTAYYHRYYRARKIGQTNSERRLRGFSDRQLYMAHTSQTKIPSMKVTHCKRTCTEYVQRWTYAIPLEIIYLTPLNNWNPHNISLYAAKSPGWYNVTKFGRDGGFTAEKAYNGNHDNVWYHTPEELFMKLTPKEHVVGVLDSEGKVRRMVASGTRIHLPNIPGVGILRQRYPISPIYAEGSTVYKELDSLKDLVLRKTRFQHMFYAEPSGGAGSGSNVDSIKQFNMALATHDPPGKHTHVVNIPESQVKLMMEKRSKYVVESARANGHSHELVIRYDKTAAHPWVVQSCDGAPICWDEHPLYLELDGE